MKTHKELLTELIDAVYALPISPSIKEVHDLQMQTAEIKGEMLATNPLQNETPSPQPDADGWVVNTGVKPECEISAVKFKSGGIEETTDKNWHWPIVDESFCITHYKPA